MAEWLISTSKANCRDCHRCLRECPLKAIRLTGGQAQILPERCILCGRCVGVCSQQAKEVQSNRKQVEYWLRNKLPVVVSIAPSFPAAFPGKDLPGVSRWLRSMGFAAVEETAVGAQAVANAYCQKLKENRFPLIDSCCPAVVNLIEKHFPELIPYVSDTLSPMMVHCRQLKERWGFHTKVVFIGPCLAKIAEGRELSGFNGPDAVLTFDELKKVGELFASPAEDEGQDEEIPRLDSRHFSVSTGVLSAMGLNSSLLDGIISVSGVEDCMALFSDMAAGRVQPRFVEAMACRGGCINGPGLTGGESFLARTAEVVRYVKSLPQGAESPLPAVAKRPFTDRHKILPMPSEEQIRAILSRTGKFSPADETNCGGCGYPTCREKAIAVFQGLAEIEMCVPYMKAKAESLAHRIVEVTPSAIIVVDGNLIIQEFNPSAEAMFNRKYRHVKGKPLYTLMDPDNFAEVLKTGERLDIVVPYPHLGLLTRQVICPLPQYGVVVGIITNITSEEKQRAQINMLKAETFARAKAVMEKQMQVVQEIASLLGETTAETKATLLELLWMTGDGGEGDGHVPRS